MADEDEIILRTIYPGRKYHKKYGGNKMKQKIKLDAYEQEIEDNIEKFVPVTGKEKQHIERIIEAARKNVTISLRINNYELDKIKEKADRSGLSCQAFITSILHKYLKGELFDKGEVIKTFNMLKTVT